MASAGLARDSRGVARSSRTRHASESDRRARQHANPCGSQHRLWRAFVARCVPEEARLELIRAEDPFHARLVIRDEGANEVPIARFVEAEDAVAQRREAEAIEAEPAVAVRGQAAGVSRKEQQICVAPSAVGAMPGMCASVGGR